MSRPVRLNRLLQLLRQHRRPVRGQVLAEALGISLRTLYRDIATLQQQGADLRGEAGVGYLLEPSDILPPLTLPAVEVDALVLGLRWVASRTDATLAGAARDALARIGHALPAQRRVQLQSCALRVPPATAQYTTMLDAMPTVRQAITAQLKLLIEYQDQGGRGSQRQVWPFALGYFDEAVVLAAWCEQRKAFRHFRLDRIQQIDIPGPRYPTARNALLQQWQQQEGIAPDWLDRC